MKGSTFGIIFPMDKGGRRRLGGFWHTARALRPGQIYLLVVVSLFTGNDFNMSHVNLLSPYIKRFVNDTLQSGAALIPASSTTSEWAWSGVTSIILPPVVLGAAFLLPFMMERVGRRDTGMLLGPVTLFITTLVNCLSYWLRSYWLLLLSRALLGLSNVCAVAAFYLVVESFPDQSRGFAAMAIMCGTNLLNILSSVAALPVFFGSDTMWAYFPLVGAALSFVQMVLSRWLPPSPKWLYVERRDPVAAAHAVRWYHGPEADVASVLDEFEREMEATRGRKSMSVFGALRLRHLRLPLAILAITTVADMFNGLVIKGQYLVAMLVQYGIPEAYSSVPTIFLSLLSAIGCFLSALGIESLGRRPLLFSAIAINLVGLACLFFGAFTSPSTTAEVCGIAGNALLMVGSVLGLGRFTQVLMSELCPQAVRASAASAYMYIVNSVNTAEVLLYPPLIASVGAWFWLPYIAVQLVAGALCHRLLPETMGRAVADVLEREFASPESDALLADGDKRSVERYHVDG